MTSMLTARVDSEKRSLAEKVFSEVGLTTSGAVNLFICAVALHGGIPFPIGLQKNESIKTKTYGLNHTGGIKLGIANGRYDFPANFDQAFDEADAEVAELFG